MAASDQLVSALRTIGELGPDRISDQLVARAAELRGQVDERLARGHGLTVAALGGGTGVGKSALLNALVGTDLAVEGLRRPTTSEPLAAYREDGPGLHALLDWLAVPERHAVGQALPGGLVLIDLPDHDSYLDAHRATAARYVQRVDVLVWVVDPLKYARADTHAGVLWDLTSHAEILLVVLNRTDELDADEVRRCREDLEMRLTEEGLAAVETFETSAATGAGVSDLAERLAEIAEHNEAAARRLAADADVLAERIDGALEPVPELDAGAEELLPAVMEATDAHRYAEEAAAAHREAATAGSRSWLGRMARSPMIGLRHAAARLGIDTGPVPGPTMASTPARVQAALARSLDTSETVGRVHHALFARMLEASERASPRLLAAVQGVGLEPRRRHWWRASAVARGLAEATALFGLVWLIVIGVVRWLQLPPMPVPMINEDWSWPAVLFIGGLAARVLLGIANRVATAVGSRRHRRAVTREIERRLSATIDETLLEPVRRELDAQRELRTAVRTLSRPR